MMEVPFLPENEGRYKIQTVDQLKTSILGLINLDQLGSLKNKPKISGNETLPIWRLNSSQGQAK